MKLIDKIKQMSAEELAEFLIEDVFDYETLPDKLNGKFCKVGICPDAVWREGKRACRYEDEDDKGFCTHESDKEQLRLLLYRDDGTVDAWRVEESPQNCTGDGSEYTLCHAQEHKLIADGLRELNKNFETQDKLASLRAKEIIAIRNEQRKLNERYDVLERAIVALTK
jgi:hypothetical protein